ncbi:MAG: polymer-forming cytoskeletal protein, partial [Sandaracinaceae bacterium]|nr:polymer-forming cytoskeletal protein [Sandaracinaceae bacterium]
MTTSMGLGSRLPRGVVLEGSIRGQGDLRVAGEVLGPIEIDGHLVIEAGAAVRGEVRARTITVAGLLEGNATALELVRLEPGARMTGDARAERVSAAQGALLKGRVRTSQERAQLERMRRTTGGTLLAPFSSSGSILSPLERSSSGELAAPSSSGALHAPTLDAFAEAAVARVTREAVIDARDRATVATP